MLRCCWPDATLLNRHVIVPLLSSSPPSNALIPTEINVANFVLSAAVFRTRSDSEHKTPLSPPDATPLELSRLTHFPISLIVVVDVAFLLLLFADSLSTLCFVLRRIAHRRPVLPRLTSITPIRFRSRSARCANVSKQRGLQNILLRRPRESVRSNFSPHSKQSR